MKKILTTLAFAMFEYFTYAQTNSDSLAVDSAKKITPTVLNGGSYIKVGVDTSLSDSTKVKKKALYWINDTPYYTYRELITAYPSLKEKKIYRANFHTDPPDTTK